MCTSSDQDSMHGMEWNVRRLTCAIGRAAGMRRLAAAGLHSRAAGGENGGTESEFPPGLQRLRRDQERGGDGVPRRGVVRRHHRARGSRFRRRGANISLRQICLFRLESGQSARRIMPGSEGGQCCDLLCNHYVPVVCFLQTGGPTWPIYLGRRDGIVSSQQEANSQIPAATLGYSQLMAAFANVGLSQHDLVTLSGSAHSHSHSSKLRFPILPSCLAHPDPALFCSVLFYSCSRPITTSQILQILHVRLCPGHTLGHFVRP